MSDFFRDVAGEFSAAVQKYDDRRRFVPTVYRPRDMSYKGRPPAGLPA